jgi:hypothetical protein
MGNITVANRLALASQLLDDPDGDRWSSDFLLESLNDGQRDIVSLRPDANPVVAVVQFGAGCFQEVPAAYSALVGLRCNMGTDGSSRGRMIEQRNFAEITEINPYWPADDPASEGMYWMYDRKNNPRQYAVYPPQPSTGQGYAEAVFSQLPADVAVGGTITLGDEFAEPLLFFMLSRAKSLDRDDTVDITMAEKFRRAYLDLLGVQDEVRQKSGGAA